MEKTIKLEKLFFELFWLFLTAIVAMVKLYLEFLNNQSFMDYQSVLYTLLVFIVPTMFNIRSATTLFMLQYENKMVTNEAHKRGYSKVHKFLYYSFWIIVCSTIVLQMVIFNFDLGSRSKKIVFVLVIINYSFALFLGATNKFLNYLESYKEGRI